jgi:hypothetical protein
VRACGPAGVAALERHCAAREKADRAEENEAKHEGA